MFYLVLTHISIHICWNSTLVLEWSNLLIIYVSLVDICEINDLKGKQMTNFYHYLHHHLLNEQKLFKTRYILILKLLKPTLQTEAQKEVDILISLFVYMYVHTYVCMFIHSNFYRTILQIKYPFQKSRFFTFLIIPNKWWN